MTFESSSVDFTRPFRCKFIETKWKVRVLRRKPQPHWEWAPAPHRVRLKLVGSDYLKVKLGGTHSLPSNASSLHCHYDNSVEGTSGTLLVMSDFWKGFHINEPAFSVRLINCSRYFVFARCDMEIFHGTDRLIAVGTRWMHLNPSVPDECDYEYEPAFPSARCQSRGSNFRLKDAPGLACLKTGDYTLRTKVRVISTNSRELSPSLLPVPFSRPLPAYILPRLTPLTWSLGIAQSWRNNFYDFVIVCQGKTFRCHKFILSSRSPVFDAMLSCTAFREAREGRLELENARPEAVEGLLHFIYCHCHSRRHMTRDSSLAYLEALCLARKYLVEIPPAVLYYDLQTLLNAQNAVKMVEVAYAYGLTFLQTIALKFALLHADRGAFDSYSAADLPSGTRALIRDFLLASSGNESDGNADSAPHWSSTWPDNRFLLFYKTSDEYS